MKRNGYPAGVVLARLVAIAAVALVAFASLLPLEPPPAAGPQAPADEFSAARAMAHVRAIAASPRAPGSAGHRRARDYIVERLRGLGLRPELQTGVVVLAADRGRIRSFTPINVLARLEGNDEREGAILLVAHYDSVAESPGAGDDAAAVAALLETLRALRAGPPLARDVIVLFSDLEEDGHAGATVFAEEHPWFRDVELVLNFEARGARGPSLLFETGSGSGRGVAMVADATPAVGSSYAAAVYALLPYGSDFTVFRGKGLPGYNFAFIGDRSAYHSPTDVADRLSPDSLQHHGAYALGLTRAFGRAGSAPVTGEAEYFNLPLAGMVVYPSGLAKVLGVLVGITTLAVVIVALARRRIRLLRMLVVFALLVAALAVSAAAALMLGPLAMSLTGGEETYLGDGVAFSAAWAALAACLVFAMSSLAVRKRRVALPGELVATVLLLWALLTLLTALLLPGSSYLALWPCLSLLLATGWWLVGGGEAAALGRGAALALLLAALVALLLWVPTVYLVGLATGASEVVFTALLAAVAATLLAPLWLVFWGRRSLLAASAGLVLAVVAIVALGAAAQPSARHPRRASLVYVWDDLAGSAHWTTIDLDPAPAIRPLVPPDSPLEEKPELFEGYPLEVFFADAEATTPLPPPEVDLLSARPADGGVSLRLRVRSRRAASHLNMELEGPPGLRVSEVDGEELAAPAAAPEFYTLRFLGTDPDGHEVELWLPAGGAVTYNAVDRSYDLPAATRGAVEVDDDTVLMPMTLSRTAGTLDAAAAATPEAGADGEAVAAGQAVASDGSPPTRLR